MKLFNTLTRQVEEFKALENKKVSIYTCGPTVYDVAHIGNLRAYIFGDLLKRVLIGNGFSVNHVMNITDVEDKTIKRGEGKWQKFKAETKKYEDKFWQDMEKLNNLKPNSTPHATAYVDQIVAFILELEKKGFAYRTTDGSVYFSIEKFKDYGKLSHLDKDGLKVGARVAQDEYTKENPADFALWKAWSESDGEISWDSPFGKGRPGWHIECSVMATSELGDTVDIHTGGVDLIFPHHENEIAQTEAKTGKKFVNFWLHNEHLLVDGKKMSKSLHNFYVLDNIIKKGFSPLDFRYLVLQSHYRSKMNFTWAGLEAAKNTREKLERIAYELVGSIKSDQIHSKKGDDQYKKDFLEALSNDLMTPEALAIMWEMLRDGKLGNVEKFNTLLWISNILGLGIDIPIFDENISELAFAWLNAYREKNFQESDRIRSELAGLGYSIGLVPEGTGYVLVPIKK
jgi:cysteinyl-tRNA synthetase